MQPCDLIILCTLACVRHKQHNAKNGAHCILSIIQQLHIYELKIFW